MHTDAYICQLICTVVISGFFLTQEYKLQVSETDAVRKYLDQKGFKLKGKVKSVVKLWCSGMWNCVVHDDTSYINVILHLHIRITLCSIQVVSRQIFCSISNHWADWCSWNILGYIQEVHTSNIALMPDTVAEIFHGFTESIQVVASIKPWLLSSSFFPFHNLPFTLPFKVHNLRYWEKCKVKHKINE
jgi:hypothetical protein